MLLIIAVFFVNCDFFSIKIALKWLSPRWHVHRKNRLFADSKSANRVVDKCIAVATQRKYVYNKKKKTDWKNKLCRNAWLDQMQDHWFSKGS